MGILLERIKEVLLENRIDDVKKKFPTVNDDIIDFFVRNDPSGNQKYLEWMVKAFAHLPTVHSINGELLGYTQAKHGTAFTEPHIETANEIINLIKDFHQLLPYMVHTNEDGKKEGTTDLYQYKFIDSESIHHLNFDLSQAKERKEKKEKEKELRKGIDKIYEDKNWLVVRPKNWESSCHYGAGTKWCTTSKETSNHFTRETVNNFLIYVINKNLYNSNDDYKVAWQIPYTKNVDVIINPLNFEVKMTGLRLWNAQDNDITSLGYDQLGEDYLKTVPKNVIKAISDYMKREMAEMYKNLGFVDNPHIQALVEQFQLSQEDAEEIEELGYTNYGLKVYSLERIWGNTGYMVGDEDDVDLAKIEWAREFIDMNSILSTMEYIGGDYYYIRDQATIARELTDSYIDDLSDEEILDNVKPYQKENHTYYLNLQKNLKTIDTYIDNLKKSFQEEEISKYEYEIKLGMINTDRKKTENELNNLFDYMKGKLYNVYKERYIEEMQDPIRWMKDWGWWENGKPSKDAFDRGLIGIDEEAVVTDLANGRDVDYFSSTGDYWWVQVADNFYYIIPTDI